MEATQTRIDTRRASGHYDYVVGGPGPAAPRSLANWPAAGIRF